jgi:hypothetical protein
VTLLIWRQWRTGIAAAAAILAVLTVAIVISGLHLHHAYQLGLARCQHAGTCGDLQEQLFRGEGTMVEVINLTVLGPPIIGIFLGAPLAARDFEQHTNKLIWTQAITRRRWFLTRVSWLALLAVSWSAALAGLVTWWSGPLNALSLQRFWPGQFDIQGIVPAAYALFGLAVGTAVGVFARRTVTALAIATGTFIGTRALVASYLRPRYLPPAVATFKPGPHPAYTAQGNWTLGVRASIPHGAGPGHGRMAYGHLADGVRQIITFQPADRYWLFQGIEAGLYLLLAALLITASLSYLRRVDG